MTTNARDGKWSEWIHNKAGLCPVEPGTHIEYKMDKHGTAVSKNPERLRWSITGDQWSDIIAYRYKIKEPESEGGWTPEAIKAAAFSTPEEDEAWQAKERELNRPKYSAYFKDVRHIDTLDVYRVVSLFGCEKHGHPISHAAKKLLLSGSRTGGKDVESDIREAIDTLHRWLEMREEDSRAM